MKASIALWTREWAEIRGWPFCFYKKTSGTNDKAKEYALRKKVIKKKLFITADQTKGRGRGNRVWINSDMMLSWSYTLNKAPQPVTTSLMGEALLSALKQVWGGRPFRIKKPNDIYAGDKKMAGLLVEVVNKGLLHHLVVGVGMNVFTSPVSLYSSKEHLSYPKNTLSNKYTHLSAHIKTKDITKSHWFMFLDEWQGQIDQKLAMCTLPSVPPL